MSDKEKNSRFDLTRNDDVQRRPKGYLVEAIGNYFRGNSKAGKMNRFAIRQHARAGGTNHSDRIDDVNRARDNDIRTVLLAYADLSARACAHAD